ncbi:hypothetical protein EJ08DRAFT_702289 [Tothia fuscella]|uniref:Uncharacterized protein n=1 Tax=Tothia fuscella TaxID=1048955 RepID=A0A9P4TTX3_9PEZI|nr:hypothetical protein EJ08DRAFT_702289 [Tothia fuscella]
MAPKKRNTTAEMSDNGTPHNKKTKVDLNAEGEAVAPQKQSKDDGDEKVVTGWCHTQADLWNPSAMQLGMTPSRMDLDNDSDEETTTEDHHSSRARHGSVVEHAADVEMELDSPTEDSQQKQNAEEDESETEDDEPKTMIYTIRTTD